MKRLFLFFCCAAVLLWSGCSKDSDGVNPDQLIGKWLLTSEYDEWVNDQGEVEGEYDPYTFEESFYIEFRADATGTIWDTTEGSTKEEFGYRFDTGSQMLYWTYGGLSDDDNPPYIEKLNASELIMTWYYEEGGKRLSEKSIFQRVD
ncbi:hypothetical protein B5E60_13155 [Alistipes sp. An116]|uniref:hypothetical protein n=1 Tax=Alistipes sp. An116 TaxID=1965546 RepID=UPI000B37975E|nr:hypothetical protein [Alistipes sp. An116]OUQ50254.1 hypothetical protein B5E60_13155 [Alistipes sp. An116]